MSKVNLASLLKTMVEQDAYCTKILGIALSMQGHLKHIQGMVLESHLHTCAPKNLSSTKAKQAFISDLLKVIGLSRRF